MADTWEPCFKQHGRLQTTWPLVAEGKPCTAVHSQSQVTVWQHNYSVATHYQYSTLISFFITVFIITWPYLGSQQQLWHKSKLALKQSTVLESLATVKDRNEHPQRDVQVTRARRRALHLISPHNCCSVPTCPPRAWLTIILPHRMTWITHVGIKCKPVFTESLQFSSLGPCYNPSASPHAAQPPGSIVTNTITGAQAPATYINSSWTPDEFMMNMQNSVPRCSTSLPPTISIIHSSSFLDSYLLSYFWCQKLEFQTLPSQASLILQSTLLLPLRQFSQN